jgi:cob(I)alamin adenosyltransferase
MMLYTGSGDDGTTGLNGGKRVSKDSLRPETCGTVDELNAHLGLLIAHLPEECNARIEELHHIQEILFRIGSVLGTVPGSPEWNSLPGIVKSDISFLEKAIGRLEQDLPELKTFIPPGGHTASAQAHVARTVCRRAERRVVQLARQEQAEGLTEIYIYLNRLADYLFTCARWCNKESGEEDITVNC